MTLIQPAKNLEAALQAGKVGLISEEPMALELMYSLIGAHPEKRCLEPHFSPNGASEQIKMASPNEPPVYDDLGFELDYALSTRPDKPRSFFRTQKW